MIHAGKRDQGLSVHYHPLPLDSRVDFFIGNSRPPPFEKCIAPGAFIQINTVIRTCLNNIISEWVCYTLTHWSLVALLWYFMTGYSNADKIVSSYLFTDVQ